MMRKHGEGHLQLRVSKSNELIVGQFAKPLGGVNSTDRVASPGFPDFVVLDWWDKADERAIPNTPLRTRTTLQAVGRKQVEVKRLAAVFARDSDFLVEPNCQTTTGLWLSADPVVFLPRPTSAAELGPDNDGVWNG